MTTELIKELVGLAVDRGIDYEFKSGNSICFSPDNCEDAFSINIDEKCTTAQLQAAIDKVKEL